MNSNYGLLGWLFNNSLCLLWIIWALQYSFFALRVPLHPDIMLEAVWLQYLLNICHGSYWPHIYNLHHMNKWERPFDGHGKYSNGLPSNPRNSCAFQAIWYTRSQRETVQIAFYIHIHSLKRAWFTFLATQYSLLSASVGDEMTKGPYIDIN